MFNSIRARLTASLLLALVLVGGIAGAIAFYDTYRETRKLQDELLRQIATFISPEAPLPQNPERRHDDVRVWAYIIAPGEQADFIQLPENIAEDFYTFRKRHDKLVLVKEKNRQNFLYDLKHAGELYRAYIRPTPQGNIVVVQENEYREELARHAVWASLLPLLALLPILALLIFWIVKRTMRPIFHLSEKVANRPPQDLTPLSTEHIPTEVGGFIQAINQLLARTEQFVERQKRFIADAAHELRSPMTALSLQAERLNRQEMPERIKSLVVELNRGIRRSRDLLEQLLSLARSQNQTEKPKHLLGLHDVFSRVIGDLLPLAEQKNQDIGVVSKGNPHFFGNETDLYLLVKTLVDNAVRYTPEGSRIDLSAVENGQELVISVEDNGEGIPAAERKRVLEPFYRILGTDQQGSGLGLSIAHSIVQNYQGRIELLPSPNFEHGLMVKITFENH